MSDDLTRDLEAIASAIPAAPRHLAELRWRLQNIPAPSATSLPGVRPSSVPSQEEAAAALEAAASGNPLVDDAALGTQSGTSITPGTVVGGDIIAKSVPMTQFVTGIIPPRVVTTLPTLPDDNFPDGCYVYLPSDETLYCNIAGTWTAAREDELVANNIYAGRISAMAVGARELAATIILGSLIKTADTGYRVEIDADGIRCINASNVLMVNIPTNDADPVYFHGQVLASSLTVTPGNASFAGSANQFLAGSVTSLLEKIEAPSAAPVLSQTWDSKTVSVPTGITSIYGLTYSAAGGSGGATKCFYRCAYANPRQVNEILASDGSTNRTVTLDATYIPYSACVHGSSLYIVVFKVGGAGAWEVQKRAISDLSLTTTYDSVSWPDATPLRPSINSDGTNLYICDINSSGYPVWNTYDASMTKTAGPTTASFNVGASAYGSYAGNADFGAWRMVTGFEDGLAHVFDSSGTHMTNECFPVPSDATHFLSGIAYGDAEGDGARFWSYANPNWSLLAKHSTWTWTTESDKYWVSYSWYDSVATTHETAVGPRASTTMSRRKRLDVSCAPIPVGTDVDNHRVYMVRGTTDPGAGNYWLQATMDEDAVSISSYTSSGTSDGSGTAFPAVNPAELKATGGEWSLKGDGTATFPIYGGLFHGTTANDTGTLDLNTADDDPGGFLDAANDRLVIPTGGAGLYAISATVSVSGATGNYRWYISTSDGNATFSSSHSTSNAHAQTCTMVAELAEGETISVVHTGTNPSTCTLSRLTATRIGLSYTDIP